MGPSIPVYIGHKIEILEGIRWKKMRLCMRAELLVIYLQCIPFSCCIPLGENNTTYSLKRKLEKKTLFDLV